MAWRKKSNDPPTSSSSWGGGGDFWGAAGTLPDTPPMQQPLAPAAAISEPSLPPEFKRPLLEHLQPLFLYVCEQHRLAKERGASAVPYETVRQTVLNKVDQIDQAARFDPLLRQHLDKLKQPILWYLDSTFGSPDNAFAFRKQWNEQCLADYGEDGKITGDEAFFDELDRELKNDPKDEAANERLTFYYTALGLGFTGRYFRRDDADRRELKACTQRIYPRIGNCLDTDASGKVTPECYRYTDKRGLVMPSRDKPLIFFFAFLLLLCSLIFGYIYWYDIERLELYNLIRDLDLKDRSTALPLNSHPAS